MNALGALMMVLALNQQVEIESLVSKMGDEVYDTREEASEDILKYGKNALPALGKAIGENPSPEIRFRATRAATKITKPLFKEECENVKPYTVVVKYGYSSCTGTIIKSNSNKSYVLSMVSPLDYYAESEWNMVKPTISVTYDGTEYEAVVVARHKTRDMALLSFEKGDLPTAELALNMDNCARICHWGFSEGSFTLKVGDFRPETPNSIPKYDIATGYGTGGVGIFAFEKDCKLRLCAVAFGTDEAGKTQVTSLGYIKEFLKGIKELE